MKKVLFISTSFNSYYLEIIKEFEKRKFEVDWFSDRPSNSTFIRALIRVNKNLVKHKIKKYEKKLLDQCENKKYDYVFVILGQALSCDFWAKLKEKQSTAKFIYYTWDSSENFDCIAKNIKYFDKVFCFDKRDSKKFDCCFLPLFYINSFVNVNENIIYDYSYIGTVKPYRYSEINSLIAKFNYFGMKGYKYLYLHSRFVLKYYKIKYRKEFWNVRSSDLAYHYLSKEECAKIESQSKIIIDVPQKNQQGLTIRTFEALALKRKLITTNEDIVNYDFYDKNNVYIVKNGTIDFNDSFFKTDYKQLDESIYEKYSITNWLNKILEA